MTTRKRTRPLTQSVTTLVARREGAVRARFAQEVAADRRWQDAWYATTVDAHRAADDACGRQWSCACGACRAARQEQQR